MHLDSGENMWPLGFQYVIWIASGSLFCLLYVFTCNSFTSWESFLWGETPLNSPHITKLYVTVRSSPLLNEMRGADVIGPDCYMLLTLSVIMYDNSFCLVPLCFHVRHGCTMGLQPSGFDSDVAEVEKTKTVLTLVVFMVLRDPLSHCKKMIEKMWFKCG